MLKSILSILLAGVLLLGGGSIEAANLLFDESHDQVTPMSSDWMFSEARSDLQTAGHQISALSGSPDAITAGALSGYDTFVTGTMQLDFTTAEISALWDFVGGGGGVIVTHDGGYYSNNATASVNLFLEPYGVSLSNTLIEPTGVVVSNMTDHCLFDGITTLGFDYLRVLESVEYPATDLQAYDPHLMALYDDGDGWVLVIGDMSQWSDTGAGSENPISEYGNRQFLLNVFGFSNCDISPVDNTSWSAIKVLY